MKFKLTTAAAAILAASLVASYAYASDPTPPVKKHTVTKKQPVAKKPVVMAPVKVKAPKPPSVEEQIQSLRSEFEGKIDGLKGDLAAKDVQLKQAQDAAAAAQAAADRANAAASAQNQAVTDNAAAVSTLQSTVTDLKGNQVSLAATVSDETAKIKKDIASPDALHFKGITLSPTGSFVAAETAWRNAATGGGLNTQFTGVPLQNADAANMSEFQGSGRQSRLALKAIGQVGDMTMTGYYELDWLGTGITSNNNQSNSYVMRQRQIWARAALKNGWTFSGGQMWSLAAETTKGLENGTKILPATIDPQYEAGFVWTRQYGFRVAKEITKKVFVGASVENAETLNPGGSNLPTNLLIGSAGNAGGLYNVNNNYSFNLAPDFVAKIAIEPGWGHFEIFDITRFFRARIYPTSGSSVGAYNDNEEGFGIGGGFRGNLADKKVTIGVKGLWGTGIGRYGSSTIADVTLLPDGQIEPLEAFSGLSTVELNPNKRLTVYLNYGGDYVYRDYQLVSGKDIGYGGPLTNMSGCNTEPYTGGSFSPTTPANCGGNNKDVQEGTLGYWYNIYNGRIGRLRQGLQYSYIVRNLWSGAGGTANPSNSAEGTDSMVFTSFRYYLP